MSVLKLKYTLPILLAAVLGAITGLSAQYDPAQSRIDSLSARIDSLAAVQGTLARKRAGMLVRSSDLSARIDRLRGGGGGPLDKYRLNSSLALSQSLADSIDLLNEGLDELQQEIDGLRLDAIAALTAALDSLSRLMKVSPAGPRGMLATRFERLRERRQGLASVDGGSGERGQRRGESRMTLTELAGLVKIKPQESAEEIAEKSAFLSDIELRWSRALEALEQNIGRLEEERDMRGRMGEFTQELALFDETGPSGRSAAVQADGNNGQESLDGDRQPSFGPADGYSDYSTNAKQLAESISLNIQISDPETELRLMQELDRFSNLDITDLAALLRARRDSLATDLDNLIELHQQLNREADLE